MSNPVEPDRGDGYLVTEAGGWTIITWIQYSLKVTLTQGGQISVQQFNADYAEQAALMVTKAGEIHAARS